MVVFVQLAWAEFEVSDWKMVEVQATKKEQRPKEEVSLALQ